MDKCYEIHKEVICKETHYACRPIFIDIEDSKIIPDCNNCYTYQKRQERLLKENKGA